MVKTHFVRSRPEMARKLPRLSAKRGFKPESVLTEDIQGSRKAVPEVNRTFSFIAKTAGKALRWTTISASSIAPFMAACSVTHNDKIHAGTISLATIGIMAVGLSVVWAGAEGVRALINRFKNKKENKPESV